MEQVKFSILISTRNRRADLLLTLQKIRPLLDRNDTECVVFDDGSTDGTFEMVRLDFPNVKLQRNETAKGYIFCRNRMLDETRAGFAVSLDDDAHFLSENPLAEIENYFDANPQTGVIAFRIYWGKTPPANTRTTQMPQRVKAFVGCGHAWRMEAWRDIPAYPEWFGFYGEEEFASFELFKKRWHVSYLPQILIQHRVEMALRKSWPEFNFRYRRSLRSGWHNYFLFYPIPKIPKHFAYSFAMQLKKMVKGDFKVVVPVFYALADVVAAIPKYAKNRNGLNRDQFAAYKKLPDTKLYWRCENE